MTVVKAKREPIEAICLDREPNLFEAGEESPSIRLISSFPLPHRMRVEANSHSSTRCKRAAAVPTAITIQM